MVLDADSKLIPFHIVGKHDYNHEKMLMAILLPSWQTDGGVVESGISFVEFAPPGSSGEFLKPVKSDWVAVECCTTGLSLS